MNGYQRYLEQAYKRIRGKSKVISSPYGNIEYTEGGTGPHVLVIHGSGGGFDQGELIAETLLCNSFHWIAPSRFGYLKSTFHEGYTFEEQTHAYAFLLDYLGVEDVAVVALSHGGPSALLFAALYPERVSSLSLISAGVTADSSESQRQANKQGNSLITIYKYDWLYWGITRLFKKRFIRLMGAADEVISKLTTGQKNLVNRIIEEMNPASPRYAGAVFDNLATLPGNRIASIQSPTFIFHAKDDTLQRFHNAEYAATTITGAKLVSFERGGHLIIATEQATIQKILQKHILEYYEIGSLKVKYY